MKIRLNSGEVIEVNNGTTKVPEAPDWDAYRMEVAKDILCALLQKDGPRGYAWWTIEQAADTAVKQADALIKQLKEK